MKKRILSFLLCLILCVGMVAFITPQAHAASEMKTSDDGIAYIKSVEGFSKYPYYDYGQYTVGYGTRCPGDKYSYYKSNGITEEEAEELLKEFLAYFESEVNTKLIDKYGLTLTQSQFDALVSFSFNIGTSWLSSSKMSTIKTMLVTDASPNDIVYAFGLYCHAGGEILPGLVTRRLCEANMYLNGVYSKTKNSDYGYVYFDGNGGKVDNDIQCFIISETPATADDAYCSGHEFMGWYTDVFGGTKVESLANDLVGKTLFAHWDTPEGSDLNPMKPVTVKVTDDGINIRKGPGTSYDQIGKANTGDELVITRVIVTTMKWGQFDKGWICLDYTNYEDVISGKVPDDEEPEVPEDEQEDDKENETPETLPDEKPIAVGTVKVNDSLRIRKGPGTNYETVGYLKNGDKVDIFETQVVGEMTWGRIGVYKWTSLSYVEVEDIQDDTTDETHPIEPEPNPTDPAPTEPAPTEHEHKYDSIVVAATCTTDGHTTHTCECGDTYDDSNVDKLGHDFSEWATVKEATVDEEGEEERTCSRCSEKEVRKIDKLPAETTPPSTTEPSPEETTPGTESGDPDVTDPNKPDETDPTDPTDPDTDPTEPDLNEPSEPEELTGTVKVNDSLRVRSGPGTSYETVDWLFNGRKVTILEQKESDGMTWGRIGDDRWISLLYVVLDSNEDDTNEDNNEPKPIVGIITADCLRIRQGAGTSYDTIGYLYQGTQVSITEQKTVGKMIWGKISNGWISMDYVKISSSNESQNQDVVKTITADCLRIRKGAGTHTATVGYLYEGDKVTILEIQMVDGTEWGRINKGWISLKYAK